MEILLIVMTLAAWALPIIAVVGYAIWMHGRVKTLEATVEQLQQPKLDQAI